MFRAAQNPFNQRVVNLACLLCAYLCCALTPALCQTVSPSGYRYDTPYGDPYHPNTTNDPNSAYYPNKGHYPGYRPSSPTASSPYTAPTTPNTFDPNVGVPATRAPFPAYTPPSIYSPGSSYLPSSYGGVQSSGASTGRTTFTRLNAAEMHEKVIWSAPSSEEQDTLARIQQMQVIYGPNDVSTLRYMLTTANYFADEQKPNQAEQLLKEIIATIQTYGVTPENSLILSVAQGRLAQMVAIDTRVSSTPVIDPNTLYVSRPSYYTGPGALYGAGGYCPGYGYGYGVCGRGYGYSHHSGFHFHFGSFHSCHASGRSHCFRR